jgi:ABC-type uncharacterized transport system involved in gliding motility auxiliary subunit
MSAWNNIPWDEGVPAGEFSLSGAKWLAGLIAYIAFLAPCATVPAVSSAFASVDWASAAASFALAVFFGAAGVALGCFVSFAVKNRGAAFLVTALALGLSNSAHLAPLYTGEALAGRALSSLARTFSFAWRFDAAGKGILDSRDFLFFIALAWAFLCLTAIAFENRRAGNAPLRNRLAQVLTIAVALGAILVSSRYPLRADARSDKRFSVSEYTRSLLAGPGGLSSSLRIDYYLSPELRSLYPQTRDIEDFLREYAGAAGQGRAALTVIDAGKADPELLFRAGVAGQEINLSRGNRLEYVMAYSGIVLEYLGAAEAIPFVLSADTLEYELDRRVLTLMEGKPPVVYVTAGNGSEAASAYSYAIAWLESAGFSPVVIESAALEAVEGDLLSPEGLASPLALLGTSALTRAEAAVIERFAASGGRVFAATSPNTVDLLSEWTVTPVKGDNFLPVLNAWGVEVSPDLVLDVSCFRLTLESGEGEARRVEAKNYPLWVTLLPRFTPPHPLTRAFSGMNLFWASPLSLYPDEDTEILPVFYTSGAAWLMQGEPNREKPFVTNPFLTPATGAESGTQGQYTLAAALEGTLSGYYATDSHTPTRVVCVGDQYVVSDAMIEYTSAAQNLDFLVNAVIWLRGEDSLLALKARLPSGMVYKVDGETLAAGRVPALFLAGILAPLAAPVFGVVFFWKRRKRR